MAALDALIRGLLRGTDNDERKIHASKRNAMFVSPDLPDMAQLLGEGKGWEVGEATAVAAVIALPTTTAQLTLHNAEPGGGKWYLVFEVGAIQVANAAPLNSWGLAIGINMNIVATTPTQDIARTSIRPLRALQGPYGGQAIVDLAATLDVDPLWKSVGNYAGATVASLPGTQLAVPIVRWLPPGGQISMAAVASAVGITTRGFFRWVELDQPF